MKVQTGTTGFIAQANNAMTGVGVNPFARQFVLPRTDDCNKTNKPNSLMAESFDLGLCALSLC